MKKILVLTLVMASFAATAFATTAQLANNALTPAAACALHGGADSTTVGVNPLGKMSTGVFAMVNYESATAKMSSGYSLFTKHKDGSKIFGTSNDATNIFWKASQSKISPAFTGSDAGTDYTVTNFGATWTSY